MTGIYLELDDINDTRYAIVEMIDKKLIDNLVKTNKYFTRIRDEFGYIPNSIFKKIYNLRDKSILKYVYPTRIQNLLLEFFINYKLNDLAIDGDGKVKCYLNIYPYKLTKEEQELIKKGLEALVNDPEYFEVEILNEYNIEPKWVKENLSVMIKYDGLKWLNRNIANKGILDNPLSDIVLYVPMLLEKDLIIKKEKVFDFFNDIEKDFGLFMKVNFLPVKIFSIKLKGE